MGRVLLEDFNSKMRNIHLLRFAKDLEFIQQNRLDLTVVFTKVPNDRLEEFGSIPLDLRILYSLVGEFQIIHNSGYIIFQLILPQEAINNEYMLDWTSEEFSEYDLKDKYIFGIEHVNHGVQNFIYYDKSTLELGLLIPNNKSSLVDIIREELSETVF